MTKLKNTHEIGSALNNIPLHNTPEIQVVHAADVVEMTFPEEARTAFIKYANDLCITENPYRDHRDMGLALAYKMIASLESIASSTQKLPTYRENARKILELIEAEKHGKNVPPAYVIHRFPVDAEENLLHTPSDPENFDPHDPVTLGKHGYVTECAMLAFNTACGMEIIQNANIQNGNMTHQITPRKGQGLMAANGGSGEFPPHTEAVYRPVDNEMDGLSLATLRNHSTPTIVITEKEIIEAVRGHFTMNELMDLEKPVYEFRSGVAYNKGSDSTVKPMMTRDQVSRKIKRLSLNANPDKVFPADQATLKRHGVTAKHVQNMIARMAKLLNTIKKGYKSHYSNLVKIDNAHAAHSRTPLATEDKSNPATNRYLMRQTMLRSAKRLREMEGYKIQRNNYQGCLVELKKRTSGVTSVASLKQCKLEASNANTHQR